MVAEAGSKLVINELQNSQYLVVLEPHIGWIYVLQCLARLLFLSHVVLIVGLFIA